MICVEPLVRLSFVAAALLIDKWLGNSGTREQILRMLETFIVTDKNHPNTCERKEQDLCLH